MRQSLAIVIAAGLLTLSGCQRGTTEMLPAPRRASVVVVEEPTWRQLATTQDLDRLQRIDEAWTEALSRARPNFRRQLADEGALLDPQVALAKPEPPPGSYKCRLIRFGSGRLPGRFLTAFPPYFCYVSIEGDELFLTKQTGSELPGGHLWHDENLRRLIFLGATASGKKLGAYGEDTERDLAGVFERVGPFRFRLVIPRLRHGLVLDVYELTPSPIQP